MLAANKVWFLFDVMLCVVRILLLEDVCSSIRPPAILQFVSKWLNESSNFFHLLVTPSFQLSTNTRHRP